MKFMDSINYYINSLLLIWSGYIISIVTANLLKWSNQAGKVKCLFPMFIQRILTISAPCVIAAFRRIDVGVDTRNVIIGYHRVCKLSFHEVFTYDITGIGLSVIRWIIGKLTNENEQIYLFFVTLLPLYFVVLSIEKWKLEPVHIKI